MFAVIFYDDLVLMGILYVLHLITFIGLFRKMSIPLWYAAIPVVAEWKISGVVFKSMRTFYHALLTLCIFSFAAWYVGNESVTAFAFIFFELIVYAFFMMRLYFMISRSFGKGIPFSLLTAIVGYIPLWYLGYGPAQFVGGPSKVDNRPKWQRILLNASVFLLTLAEFVVLIAVVGFFSIRENPPRILSEQLAKTNIEDSAGITDIGPVVTREDAMGDAAASLDQYRGRDYFAPDHSGDQTVVVMDYVCATDLESRSGLASCNIAQLREATKAGSGLTAVLQVGGAKYLFTDGMKDGSYARYTVNNGKIEKVMDLDSTTCMTEPQTLEDFIKWTKENYPADRYMLVLWDHGGGLSSGYGFDQLNERADGNSMMPASDVVKAVASAGVQFDLIGFDTCLMQDLDVALGLEPYTDYFLASEETESGYGWNYTVGFTQLAANPGISTEEFGQAMIASFDPYNTKLQGNKPDTGSTLSLIDMAYVKTAGEKMAALFEKEKAAILADPDNYANISIAANDAYKFMGEEQLDLLGYLTNLQGLDFENAIMSDEEMQDLINSVRSCIVVRNANSAEGINGLAFSFPAKHLRGYTSVHDQLDTLGMEEQKEMYDDYFSIMACQKMKAMKENPSFFDLVEDDYTAQDWYVKGFENYDTADTFVDIPLKDTGAGYEIELPDKAWKKVTDVQVAAYLHTDSGRMYLGSDHIGSYDESGKPLIGMDNTWPHIGGNLICYNASMPRETEEGTIFSGTARALLNGKTTVNLYIECDPVAEDADQPTEAFVTGYEIVDDPLAIARKGLETLQAGDTLQFLFDYYDEEGNLVKTEPYGKTVRVTSDKPLDVKDEPLGECDIQFGGRLTDVYEREFLTETMEVHIGK